jgi:hypothetical protein
MAVAWPIPVKAPVINTTGLLIFRSSQFRASYRQSMNGSAGS